MHKTALAWCRGRSEKMPKWYPENIEREWQAEPDASQLRRAIEFRKTDPVAALRCFEALAEKGSVLSMAYIGDAYGNGRGVERDIELGDQWYRRAADCGSIEAAHRLAYRYFDQREYGRAVNELSKLCDRGFTPAMYCLGSFYYVGTGVERSIEQAMIYWSMAEERGHLLAKQKIASVLRGGELGIFGILKGYSKTIFGIIPFSKCFMNTPNSDRLRGWGVTIPGRGLV